MLQSELFDDFWCLDPPFLKVSIGMIWNVGHFNVRSSCPSVPPRSLAWWSGCGSVAPVKWNGCVWTIRNHGSLRYPYFLTTPKYSHPRNMKHLNTLNGRKYVRATCKTIVSGGCSMFRERDYSHGRDHCWPGNSWTSYILNGKVAWYMWQGNKLEIHDTWEHSARILTYSY
jgi:hypothetical protein